ncbi:hypothetical protein C8R46DRAFT_1252867, partial [Mycena filopes]
MRSQRLDRRPVLTYTRAHTDSRTVAARANAAADVLASGSHHTTTSPPTCPQPTFCMDEFTFYTAHDGFIELNISTYVQHFEARADAAEPGFLPLASLFPSLYDTHPPPDHPYIRASAAYSATLQLYIRSSQLPSAFTSFRRVFNTLPWCRAGCDVLETPHHVFVECPAFQSTRGSHRESLVRHIRQILDGPVPVNELEARNLILTADRLFVDGNSWPGGLCRYYMGVV